MSTINLDDLGNFDNLEDLQKALELRMRQHNSSALPAFEGLSPEQMYELQVNFPNTEDKGPLVMNRLSEAQLQQCPLLMQVRFIMEKMRDGKSLQLTKTGALSTALVKEIYALGHLKNYFIENGLGKVYKERDIMEINITRHLLELSSLVKKRYGKLSLTKTGEKHLDDGNFILWKLMSCLFHKFNWGYYDGYESENIGQVIPSFSLYLLKKYGDQERESGFYAEKYFLAFPQLGGTITDFRCYDTRTFMRYFKFMGFVEVTESDKLMGPSRVKKTTFLEELLSVKI
ncbi:MAG: hypothetical protein WBA61_14880 [Aequorivita sp.]